MASLLQNNASSAVGSKAQHADVLQEEEEPSYWDCEEKKKSTHGDFCFQIHGLLPVPLLFPAVLSRREASKALVSVSHHWVAKNIS